jgi:hypothetical protein
VMTLPSAVISSVDHGLWDKDETTRTDITPFCKAQTNFPFDGTLLTARRFHKAQISEKEYVRKMDWRWTICRNGSETRSRCHRQWASSPYELCRAARWNCCGRCANRDQICWSCAGQWGSALSAVSKRIGAEFGSRLAKAGASVAVGKIAIVATQPWGSA